MDASGVCASKKCWHPVQISSCSHPVPHSNPSTRSIQFAPRRMLRCDIGGKYVEYVKSGEDQDKDLWLTRHCLQESLIPLPLFNEMQEEGGVSVEPPFFVGL